MRAQGRGRWGPEADAASRESSWQGKGPVERGPRFGRVTARLLEGPSGTSAELVCVLGTVPNTGKKKRVHQT